MRVLTIVRDLGPGGTQRAAQNYSVGYQAKGHSAAVLAYIDGGPRSEPLAARGIPVWIGGTRPGQLEHALERAVGWEPDIIHVHRPGRPDRTVASILRTLRQRLPHRHAVLETNVFGKVDYSSDRSLIDLHLHLTRWSLWKWTRWTTGMRPRPVGVVMPYLVDTSRFHPISAAERDSYRRALGIPREAFVFGRVGQPLEWKWSPMVLDAFADVASKYPEAYLVLAEPPKSFANRLRQLPQPIRSRVFELPLMLSDDDLRACYGAMDTFVHASAIGESFGLVLVEAMLCGCPVVTLSTPTRDNSQVEVVGHESGGLVVTDRTSMVAAMELLIENEPLRARLREGGASVRSRFRLHENIHMLVNVARLALQAETREELRAAVQADPELVTEFPTSEMKRLLARSMGRVSVRERILMEVIHIGPLYRLYSRLLFPLKIRS